MNLGLIQTLQKGFVQISALFIFVIIGFSPTITLGQDYGFSQEDTRLEGKTGSQRGISSQQKEFSQQQAQIRTVYTKEGTKLEIEEDLKRSFRKKAKAAIKKFVKNIPSSIKKVTIGRIDGDPGLLTELNFYSFLQIELRALNRFDFYICNECKKQVAYLKKDKLYLGLLINSRESFQKLGKDQGIEAYIGGSVFYNEELEKLEFMIKAFQLKDGKVLSLESFSDQEESGFTFSINLIPTITGITARNTTTSSGDQSTGFAGAGFRFEFSTLFKSVKFAFDLNAYLGSPPSTLGTSNPQIVVFVPMLQYQFQFLKRNNIPLLSASIGQGIYNEIGASKDATSNNNITTVGLNLKVTPSTSLGLNYYQLATIKYTDDKDQNIEFGGSGIGASIHYFF
ncbi:MAG: hypothetical protein ACI86H_002963 [bacterium]|jgi:hypothetical protein